MSFAETHQGLWMFSIFTAVGFLASNMDCSRDCRFQGIHGCGGLVLYSVHRCNQQVVDWSWMTVDSNLTCFCVDCWCWGTKVLSSSLLLSWTAWNLGTDHILLELDVHVLVRVRVYSVLSGSNYCFRWILRTLNFLGMDWCLVVGRDCLVWYH